MKEQNNELIQSQVSQQPSTTESHQTQQNFEALTNAHEQYRSPSPSLSAVSAATEPPPPPPPGPPPGSFRSRRTSISPRLRRNNSATNRRNRIFRKPNSSNYDYAINEFNQTIEHSLSNDNGLGPGPGSSENLQDHSYDPEFTQKSPPVPMMQRNQNRQVSNITGGMHHSPPRPLIMNTTVRKQQGLKLKTNPKQNSESFAAATGPQPDFTNATTILPRVSPKQISSKEFSTASALAAPSSTMETLQENHAPINFNIDTNNNDMATTHTANTANTAPSAQTNAPVSLQPHIAKLEQVEQTDESALSPLSSPLHSPSPMIIANNSSMDSNWSDDTSTRAATTNRQGTTGPSSIPSDNRWKDDSNTRQRANTHQYTNLDDNYGMYEVVMPDVTYEEKYGDAYVGRPIKYIYPSGYQTLRPRGGPWKLSLVIFFFFIWLCVFIVGHCSDQVDMSAYDDNENGGFDDDELIIETRWCGSRTLYSLWVVTVLVTAMAASYCSIIGYIKMRDFSVANCRSQPPGMVGKSEYYVKINDHVYHHDDSNAPQEQKISSGKNFHSNIYQSDGTPQFWGGHIYRPTQAAVAVTSR